MKSAVLFAAALLAGCATCREHPAMCEAAAAIVIAGTVIALDQRSSDPASPMMHIPTAPNCITDPAACR